MSSRISTAQIFDSSRSHITEAQGRQTDSSEKASTLKDITRPSQGPANWVRAANLKDDLSARESIAKNVDIAGHYLETTEKALGTIQEQVQRAQELAINASSAASFNPTTRDAILSEVRALYDATLQTANTRYADRTLLGGFSTQSKAFDREGNYLGDNGQVQIEVEQGLSMPVNISGEQALLGKGLDRGVNILSTLQTLMDGLNAGDLEMIQSTLDPLRHGNDQLSTMRAEIGGRMAQMDRSTETNSEAKLKETDTISKLEDADAIKVFSDLARDQTVLRAAVSSSQKILTEVPVDILYK